MKPVLLVLGHSGALSGAEINLLRSLPEMQYFEVKVLLGEEGPLLSELRDRGITAEAIPLPAAVAEWRSGSTGGGGRSLLGAIGLVRYAFGLGRLLHKNRPDVIYTNSAKAHLYGAILAKLLRRPSVVHLHDRISPDLMSKINRTLMQIVTHHMSAGIIANSASTLKSAGLRDGSKAAAVIPCPLPRDIQTRSNSSAIGVRFVLVGRLSPWKGQNLAIEAFMRALKHLPSDSSLEIIGDSLFGESEYRASLHRLVRDCGLEHAVNFHGHVNDVSAHLPQFDVLIHSSLVPEPFGQVITEGLAAGLAVIAADSGGPSEILTHGHDGFLYTRADSAALSAAMISVGCSATLRSALARNGIETAKKYSPENVVPVLESFLSSFVEQSRSNNSNA